MQISAITLYRFSIPMEPFAIATGTMRLAQNMVVNITTKAGASGWGECSAFPYITGETQDTCLAMGKLFGEFLLGKSAADPAELSDALRLVAAGNFTAKSAFDMALYDCTAQEANQPLYAYLGGQRKSFVTDITVGIGPVETMAAQAAEFAANGATVIKVKVGKNAAEDAARIRAIRAAIGTEIDIRIDANQGYDLAQAAEAFAGMESSRIQFCEQPMRRQTGDLQLAQLAQQFTIPVMLDESVYHCADLQMLLPYRPHFHSINIKFAKCGGFAEGLRLHALALRNDIPCMIGGMLESRLGMTAFAHFAAACPGVVYYDMDTALLGHLTDPIEGGATYGKGYSITLPEGNGLGAQPDATFLASMERLTI